jgi:3',5'-cyclic AMP phosphodiesterase CpdA
VAEAGAGDDPPGRGAGELVAVQRQVVDEAGPCATQPSLALNVDVTTVADDLVVVHDGLTVRRFEGVRPDTELELGGRSVRTLPRPGGELLGRFATVNDVHFGEIECGRIDDHHDGPIQRPEPGEPPHPETMNRAAVAEIATIEPMAVIVKGDLTDQGTDVEFAAFEACYRSAFGDRLRVVRGNHDAYDGQHRYAADAWIELPGVAVALLDTAIPTATTGTISATQLDWLEHHAREAATPVVVMGHHQQWIDGRRSADYFGLHPDASEALDAVVARTPNIVAYTAGHTHRHRVRRMPRSGVRSIEIGCVKDFPGTWAEYRVYEGGIMQVVHRISSPAALSWSERCRHLYADFGVDYESYALGSLSDRCFVIERG